MLEGIKVGDKAKIMKAESMEKLQTPAMPSAPTMPAPATVPPSALIS